jgi:hypothetical protein
MDGTVPISAKLWPQRFDAAVVLVKHIFYCGFIVGKMFGKIVSGKNCAKSSTRTIISFWKKIIA